MASDGAVNLGRSSEVVKESSGCYKTATPRPHVAPIPATLTLMPAVPVTRYARGEARRAAILAATVDLIYEDGISAVTHRAVAREAGVPASAPSYFFPSIDDLVVEAFREAMGAMLDAHRALSDRIVRDDLPREAAVDAYIRLVRKSAPKYDKLQFEAYMLARKRPGLSEAVREVLASTHRSNNTIVTASRRDDLGWAAPILTALADGFGLYRLASPGAAAFQGLRTGLLALMEALPGMDPEESSPGRPIRTKS